MIDLDDLMFTTNSYELKGKFETLERYIYLGHEVKFFGNLIYLPFESPSIKRDAIQHIIDNLELDEGAIIYADEFVALEHFRNNGFEIKDTVNEPLAYDPDNIMLKITTCRNNITQEWIFRVFENYITLRVVREIM